MPHKDVEDTLAYFKQLRNPKITLPTFNKLTILQKLDKEDKKICGIYVLHRGTEYLFLISQSFLDEEVYNPPQHNTIYIKAMKNMLRRLGLDEDKATGAFRFVAGFSIGKVAQSLILDECMISCEQDSELEKIRKKMQLNIFKEIEAQLPDLYKTIMETY